MRRRLRRNENYLVIIGTGVMAFGFWSVIQTVLLLLLSPQAVSEYFDTVSGPDFSPNIGYVLLMVLTTLDLLVRLYVGLSARAEGFGAKKGNLYVVFAVLLCFFHLLALVTAVLNRFRNYLGFEDAVMSLLIDITSLVTLVELVNSIFKVRWLKRELHLSE